jgi:hypothetical protein
VARTTSKTLPAPSEARVCERTGLRLVPANRQRVWRVAKSSWGPLNPPQRLPDSERRDWNRYDAIDHRTVYAGKPEVAAYAESLAFARVGFTREEHDSAPATRTLLSELFDDEEDTPLIDAIDQEWRDLNHMAPHKLVAGWRADRRLYKLTLPDRGWFIDIESAETISAIVAALGPRLATSFGAGSLTTADLRGENRELTTTIADWLWGLVLDDGSLPHGVYYGSKHDSAWKCWAIWLRATDDGNPDREPTKHDAGVEIKDYEHNPHLAKVADLFRFQCY